MPTPASRVTKPGQTMTAFFEGVRALNGTAGQVRELSRRVFRDKQQASTYLQELQKLEQAIHLLRTEIAEGVEAQREPAEAPVTPRAQSSARKAPDSVRNKLEQMVKKRELLASAEFTREVGLSRQALSKAVGANRMFYVDFKGERYFPAFYADPMYQRSQVEAVTKLLGDLPGGAKLQFFLNRRGSLAGVTPLEALAQGKLQKVKDVAAAFADER